MEKRAMTWLLTVAVLIGGAVGIRAQEAGEGGEAAQELERERTVRVRMPTPPAPLAPGGWLGVRVDDVDAEAAGELGLDEPRGALVEGVEEESPAAEAGLEAGDVIVAFDGDEVRSVAELVRLVRETPSGRDVTLDVVRDGERRRLSATVGDRPHRGFRVRLAPGDFEDLEVRMERLGEELSEERMEEIRARIEEARERMEELEIRGGEGDVHLFRFQGRPRLGVRLQPLPDQLAEYFGVGNGGGALVASVREGSPAAAAGLRAGDVVVRFGGDEVSDPGDLVAAVREAEAGAVEVTVVRRGERRTLTVELPDRGGEEMGWRAAPAPAPRRPGATPAGPPAPAVRPFVAPAVAARGVVIL